MGNAVCEILAAEGACLRKSRVVGVGQFRAGGPSVGWPFVLCLGRPGLCPFSSERDPLPLSKNSWFG